MDPADFVLLISKVFLHLGQDQSLWPFSAATPYGYPRRFQVVSPHLLFQTEDGELTRRRGRWLSLRTMESYLQELLLATYVKRLPDESQCLIQKFASGFPLVLQNVISFLDAGIHHQVWYRLFQHRTQTSLG